MPAQPPSAPADDPVVSIVGLCLSLDDLAADLYTTYETHLNRFIEALQSHCAMTPELELLGETLQRLWSDNRLLTQYATHDELTGLLNRRGFWFLARQLAYFSQRNQTNIAVLMLDIDDFRLVNEHYGHPVGDRVLKNIAATVQARLRRSDILGRYGGRSSSRSSRRSARTDWRVSPTRFVSNLSIRHGNYINQVAM